MILLLLVGCNSADDLQALKDDMEEIRSDLQIKDDETKDMILLLQEELLQKDQVILNQKNSINSLNSEVSRLKDQLSDIKLILSAVESQQYFSDYVTNFNQQLIKNSQEYTSIHGMVLDLDEDEMTIDMDILEFVTYYDDERIKALNIDTKNEQIIAGAYIYNADDDNRQYQLSDDVEIYIHEDGNPGEMLSISLTDLKRRAEEKSSYSYTLHMMNNIVIRITEDFLN